VDSSFHALHGDALYAIVSLPPSMRIFMLADIDDA
jgi:hypothetical protein